ncbi:MAG TPA: glycosyltransferase family 39 protein [Gemmatimonadales bacterium]|nr:glycosyltransferase family 39 protein [Gemmatimonadales bacterium]
MSRVRAGARAPARLAAGLGARRAAVAAAVCWVVLTKAVEWPVFVRPTFEAGVPTDAAAFAYAGELIRQGGAPYLAFWDQKPPLIHWLNALGLALGGGGIWGIWLLGALATVAAVLLGARLLARAGLGTPAVIVGSACLAAAIPDVRQSNLTEEYALPLQVAAAGLLFAGDGRVALGRGAGAGLGVLAGLAGLLRPTLIGAMLAVALVATLAAAHRRAWGEWGRWLLAALAGATAVLALALAALAARGALGAFEDQVVHYNLVYIAASWRERLGAAGDGVRLATRHLPLALVTAGWLLAALRLYDRRPGHDGRPGDDRGNRSPRAAVWLLALVWAPLELGLAALPGRPYGHYFLALVPAFALLVALLVEALLARQPAPRAHALGVIVALGLALPAVLDQVRALDERPLVGERTRQVEAVTRYLRSALPPGAPIFVWGHAADVYLFSRHPAASRFIYPLALVTPGYVTPALIRGVEAELERARPALLVEQPTPLLPPLTPFDSTWQSPAPGPGVRRPGQWRATPALRAFYAYLARHYAVVDSVGPEHWRIWRRRSGGAVAAPAAAPAAEPS